MTEYTKKELKAMLREELKQYEAEFDDLTVDERKELRDWVARGESVYDNPHLLYQENGWPFDYVTAIRINQDMLYNPENYRTTSEPVAGVAGEPPF